MPFWGGGFLNKRRALRFSASQHLCASFMRETVVLMGAKMGQWLMHERLYFWLMAAAKHKA